MTTWLWALATALCTISCWTSALLSMGRGICATRPLVWWCVAGLLWSQGQGASAPVWVLIAALVCGGAAELLRCGPRPWAPSTALMTVGAALFAVTAAMMEMHLVPALIGVVVAGVALGTSGRRSVEAVHRRRGSAAVRLMSFKLAAIALLTVLVWASARGWSIVGVTAFAAAEVIGDLDRFRGPHRHARLFATIVGHCGLFLMVAGQFG